MVEEISKIFLVKRHYRREGKPDAIFTLRLEVNLAGRSFSILESSGMEIDLRDLRMEMREDLLVFIACFNDAFNLGLSEIDKHTGV